MTWIPRSPIIHSPLILLLATLGWWQWLDLRWIPQESGVEWGAGSLVAEARSSGGRSRSGSFRSSPSRSRSQPPSNRSSQRRSSAPQRTRRQSTSPSYRRRVPVPVPIPIYPVNPNSRDLSSDRQQQTTGFDRGDSQNALPRDRNPASRSTGSTTPATDYLWLVIPGAAVAGGVALLIYSNHRKGKARPGSRTELNNDRVTVTQLQVALFAKDCPIQQHLSEIVTTLPLETPEDRLKQLQSCVLALLRLPEYWSHVYAASQSFPQRAAAEDYFEQCSIRERSKFSAETLTRDHQGLQQRALRLEAESDPSAYVVVTLLLGTTHDYPLFEQLYSADRLQAALESLSSLSAEELLVFELLWTPQDAADSLSQDELITEFSTLVMV